MKIQKTIIDEIVDSLHKEIVGPNPNVNYLDEKTGEEVLLKSVHGSPKSRYGAGMLYPQRSRIKEDSGDISNSKQEDLENGNNIGSDIPNIEQDKKATSFKEEQGSYEEPVGLANQFLPSAMGFTVQLNNNETNKQIKIYISSAYYEKGDNQKPKKKLDRDNNVVIAESIKGPVLNDYWTRVPIKTEPIDLDLDTLFVNNSRTYDYVLKKTKEGKDWLKLRIFNRSTPKNIESGFLVITFVLINSIEPTTDDSINTKKILFQNELSLSSKSDNLIVPYKERKSTSDTEEEQELSLLYRQKRIFAIGHGASVTWDAKLRNEIEIVSEIKTSVIPTYELPQVAPTSHVTLSMLELSDYGNWNEAKQSLKKLVSEYEKWITEIEVVSHEAEELKDYRDVAVSNVKKCYSALYRIKKGVDILINSDVDSEVVQCFRWMNRAMIWQQQRSKTKLRKWIKTGGKNSSYVLEDINYDGKNFPSLIEYHDKSIYHGRWRPFQLAFVLMNIESIINPDSEERKIVDLIWFPTGGGKTEAYLGLSAFNIFYRRLKGSNNFDWELYGGTTILMRYTLRLLTTQQYERASSLICACDIIRQEHEIQLGDEAISIGLWVGGDSSPNKNKDARSQLNSLNRDINTEYNFVVMKCPSCGAQIGKIDGASRNDKIKIKGIHKEDGKNGEVYFQCENNYCEYSDKPLPLQVIDELIYKKPPTLLLGTVDKFAMVTWKEEAGSLFGFRNENNILSRINPPELIIQDELHLIAGPLGTMVGLYETMVQTLCNNYNLQVPPFIKKDNNVFIPPKIIASSATISRAYEQVKSLYGIKNRGQLSIFPPQGLKFGDTWFSEEKSIFESDENDKQAFPGRKYIGVLASGYPSAQTATVRTYSSVIQKIKELSESEDNLSIDYYWTLLGYFNSIRELGTASSLVYGDIRERLGQIQARDFIPKSRKRYINRIEELTSRISSSEIPKTLKKLETSFSKANNKALDICLATNMLATGVDISRLGLMFIHGQPKTTAEYIQASSRVGRQVPNGPGLIFSLYSPSKPRDKSQYEHFQSYHSRIYSNVEPTSVTPFSINAREKGLHAVLVALVRHFSCDGLRNDPKLSNTSFEELTTIVSDILVERCKIVDPDETDNTINLIKKRIVFWKKGFQSYGDAGNFAIKKNDGFYPLLFANSAEVKEEIRKDDRSLPTPTSMRGVDTESVLTIYSDTHYDG